MMRIASRPCGCAPHVGFARTARNRKAARARSDAEHEPAAAHVIELRRLRRDHNRVVVGMQMTPVPKCKFLVRGKRPAMNISGEGIGSLVAEKCSPTTFGKSRAIRQQRFSVSSASVSVNERAGGAPAS